MAVFVSESYAQDFHKSNLIRPPPLRTTVVVVGAQLAKDIGSL